MAELSTVNRVVPGSSPGGSAYARMVESVYTADLKFAASQLVGSSPTSGTKENTNEYRRTKGKQVY